MRRDIGITDATSVGRAGDAITELRFLIKMGMTKSLSNRYQKVALTGQKKDPHDYCNEQEVKGNKHRI